MIYGIGTDLLDIRRIARTWDRFGLRFAKRILSDSEMLRFSGYSTDAQKINFLAKRFSAKESIAKALGTGFRQGVIWTNIDISANLLNKPVVTLYGQALNLVSQEFGSVDILLSVSDQKNWVQTFSVITVL